MHRLEQRAPPTGGNSTQQAHHSIVNEQMSTAREDYSGDVSSAVSHGRIFAEKSARSSVRSSSPPVPAITPSLVQIHTAAAGMRKQTPPTVSPGEQNVAPKTHVHVDEVVGAKTCHELREAEGKGAVSVEEDSISLHHGDAQDGKTKAKAKAEDVFTDPEHVELLPPGALLSGQLGVHALVDTYALVAVPIGEATEGAAENGTSDGGGSYGDGHDHGQPIKMLLSDDESSGGASEDDDMDARHRARLSTSCGAPHGTTCTGSYSSLCMSACLCAAQGPTLSLKCSVFGQAPRSVTPRHVII